MKKKILITDPLVGKMPGILADKYPEENRHIEWIVAEKGDLEELQALAKDVDIIVGARHNIPKEVLSSAGKVSFIQQCSAGYDNIDISYAASRGITIANSGNAGVIPVAEHVIALMMALVKSIPKANQSTKDGKWIFQDLVNKVYEVNGKKFGIVGMGKIGKQVGILASGLKMEIQFYDPYFPVGANLEFTAEPVSLNQLLQTSDFVSINTNLSDETHHLIGKEELAMMKTTAYLINTSRGAVVDEMALIDALEKGRIAGAGLDVYGRHFDPPPPNSKLLELENVVLTPHIGGASAEDIFRNFYVTSLDNIIRVLRDEQPLHVVSK